MPCAAAAGASAVLVVVVVVVVVLLLLLLALRQLLTLPAPVRFPSLQLVEPVQWEGTVRKLVAAGECFGSCGVLPSLFGRPASRVPAQPCD